MWWCERGLKQALLQWSLPTLTILVKKCNIGRYAEGLCSVPALPGPGLTSFNMKGQGQLRPERYRCTMLWEGLRQDSWNKPFTCFLFVIFLTHCLFRGTPGLCSPFPTILMGIIEPTSGLYRSFSWPLALMSASLLLFLFHKKTKKFLPMWIVMMGLW